MKKKGHNKTKYDVQSAKNERRAFRKAIKKVFPSGIEISTHAIMRFFERKMNAPPFKDVRHFLNGVSKEQVESVRGVIEDRLRESLSNGKWWLRDGTAYTVRLSQSLIGVVANSTVVTVYYSNNKRQENE